MLRAIRSWSWGILHIPEGHIWSNFPRRCAWRGVYSASHVCHVVLCPWYDSLTCLVRWIVRPSHGIFVPLILFMVRFGESRCLYGCYWSSWPRDECWDLLSKSSGNLLMLDNIFNRCVLRLLRRLYSVPVTASLSNIVFASSSRSLVCSIESSLLIRAINRFNYPCSTPSICANYWN